MARNFGKAKHKNHISGAAPGTLAAMNNLFGISLEDFMKAVYGDHRAIQKLSDLGRLSEVAKTNLQPALEAARVTIQTTGDLNKAIADLTKQTKKSGKQVTSAILDSQLAERRFNNELTEAKQKYGYDVSAETTRHLHQGSLIQIRGAVADLMAVTKYQTDVTKEQSKIPLAQQRADVEYEKAVSNALWADGSDANISRIPKPNYNSNKGLGKLWKGFRDTFGI